MLENIFSSIYSAIATGLDWVLIRFLASLDISLDAFLTMVPFLGTSYKMFQTLGVGIVTIIAVYQLIKFFGGSLSETGDTPINILIRSALAAGLVYFGGYIVEYIIDFAKVPYDAFLFTNASSLSDSGILGEGFFENIGEATILYSIGGAGAGLSLGGLLIALFVIVMIGWNILKLALEIVERYVMTCLLAFVAPLPFATIGSKSTSAIFSKWLQMLLGQCIIMTLSVWSMKLVISSLAATVLADEAFIIHLIIVLAICRIGQRIDSYMQMLGIGVATTSGSLLDEMVSTVGTFDRLRGRGKGGGGGDSGGRGGVLGGISDSRGNVRPEAVGSGLIGSVLTARNYAKAAKAQGESVGGQISAAKDGAVKGFGLSKGDRSLFTGRGYNDQQTLPTSTDKAGQILQSGDGKSVLDGVASANGARINEKTGMLAGPAAAVGSMMAANFNNPDAQETLSATAKKGSSEAVEHGLFGNNNRLGFDESSGVSQAESDQLGSDMMYSTFKSSFDGLNDKVATWEGMSDSEKAAHPEMQPTPAEQNLYAAGQAMETTAMDSTDGDSGRLQNFSAANVGEYRKMGREASADLVDADGQKVASVSAVDAAAFNRMAPEEQSGYVPMQSATGASYYMKATPVGQTERIDMSGQPITSTAAPAPASAEAPVVPATGTATETVTQPAGSATQPVGSVQVSGEAKTAEAPATTVVTKTEVTQGARPAPTVETIKEYHAEDAPAPRSAHGSQQPNQGSKKPPKGKKPKS